MIERIPIEQIYMQSAELWAKRSTCCRANVGGVLVRDGRIIASGFNGSPRKTPHCLDSSCLTQVRDGRESCIRTLHCEQAIISFCAYNGIRTCDTELWITMSPCYDCAKLIVNAGISVVHYRDLYGGFNGIDLMKECGIVVNQWSIAQSA